MPEAIKKLTLLFGSRGANKVRSDANSIRSSVRSIGNSLRRMSMIGVTAFGILAAASLGYAAKFDQAMTQSIAIMGKVSDTMRNDMEKTALEVSRTTIFSAEQAGQSYFYLASAGLDAAASIKALPVVSRFAQAGMFDMALATDLLTDAQSALGLTIRNDSVKNMQNMIRVSDVLVKANTLANATVQQFSESLTNEAGAALKSFNIDIEEGVAVLAAFADQGVKANVAGSSLSRILRLMTTAAVKNSAEYKRMGITVFDASGNIRNLADIVGDLERALGNLSDTQRIAALDALGFQARVQGVILPLLGTSEAIRRYEKELRSASGTTNQVANNQLKSFTNQLKLVKNELVATGIEAGQRFLPVILGLIKGTKDFVTENENLVKALSAISLGIFALTTPMLRYIALIFLAAKGIDALQNKFSKQSRIERIQDEIKKIRENPKILGVPYNKLFADSPEERILNLTKQMVHLQMSGEEAANGLADKMKEGFKSSIDFIAGYFDEFLDYVAKKGEVFKKDMGSSAASATGGGGATGMGLQPRGLMDIYKLPETNKQLSMVSGTIDDILVMFNNLEDQLEFLGILFQEKGTLLYSVWMGGLSAASAYYDSVSKMSQAFFSGETKRLLYFDELTNQVWKGFAAGALDAIGTVLKAKAKEWSLSAAAAFWEGNFAKGAGLLAIASAAGGAAGILSGGAAGIRQTAKDDLASTLGQDRPLTQAEQDAGVVNARSGSLTRTGTIGVRQAQTVVISPTTVFSTSNGGMLFIGSGGIEEAQDSISNLIVREVKNAVEGGEFG